MEKILKIINDHAAATGNLCGISLVAVSNRSNLPKKEAGKILNRIIAEKKATVREGINQTLVFAK